jgi:hypothetical protein
MFLSLLISCVLQVPDITPMDAPVQRSPEGFTSIFDVAEMDDGRVLVTDNRDRLLFIVDFSAPSVTPLGREGEGPKEYRSAFSILPQPDGQFFVYDTSLRRFLVVAGNGTIEGVEPFNPPPLNSFSAPRGPDPEGYLYLSHRAVSPDGLAPDAILYKWHPEKADLQQIGTFANYAPGQKGRGFVPMPREDAWTVQPDGRVGKLVAEDYHWAWMDGRVSPTVDFPRVRVGKEEREAWLDELYSRSASSASSFQGGGSSPANRRPVDPGRFPRFVPPFSGDYIPAAPWGNVWVKVDPLSGHSLTVFDIFDGEGNHLRRISLEGDARVVGFGSSVVYIARKDEYDLEWLEQYAAG